MGQAAPGPGAVRSCCCHLLFILAACRPLFFVKPAESCLTSTELTQSLFLPCQALWGKPAAGIWQGDPAWGRPTGASPVWGLPLEPTTQPQVASSHTIRVPAFPAGLTFCPTLPTLSGVPGLGSVGYVNRFAHSSLQPSPSLHGSLREGNHVSRSPSLHVL